MTHKAQLIAHPANMKIKTASIYSKPNTVFLRKFCTCKNSYYIVHGVCVRISVCVCV